MKTLLTNVLYSVDGVWRFCWQSIAETTSCYFETAHITCQIQIHHRHGSLKTCARLIGNQKEYVNKKCAALKWKTSPQSSISKTSTKNVRGCQRFLVQIVLVPKATALEYEFRKQSSHLKKFYHTGTSI